MLSLNCAYTYVVNTTIGVALHSVMPLPASADRLLITFANVYFEKKLNFEEKKSSKKNHQIVVQVT